jgi:hypothetical protein
MLEDTSVPEHLGSYVTLRERDLPVLYQVVDANTLEEYHHVLQVTSTEPIIVAVWTYPGLVDTSLSRSVLFLQSNLLKLSRA